ncbi:DUF6421 family protein [Nocardioides marmoribigeumensis]|uniref:Uncharacterized protein n=1 Tax=Nocardioides marmoribigeumensis TaxID=433649 RepID=A0ABU2C151_9ACTN|nr:DUF6421 family protein [Nocardioides marmoribigeumensis]MDR7364373.1 hypothetical protein [Nocardioides marmoribigeumensis]
MTPLLHLLLDGPAGAPVAAALVRLGRRGVCVHDRTTTCQAPVDVLLRVGSAPALDRVAQGVGAVVLSPTHEHSGLAALGVHPVPAAPGPSAVLAAGEEETGSLTDEDLLARTDLSALVATTGLELSLGAAPLLRSAGVPVAALATHGAGRVVVLGVEMTDPEADELLTAAVSFTARRGDRRTPGPAEVATDPAWVDLKAAVVELQGLQVKDGSVPEEHRESALPLVDRVVAGVEALAPRFPWDTDYLRAVVKDLRRWADGGLGEPDFLDAMVAFHPAADRVDGRQHLVVFPMYTQNGSPDRHVEAVLLEVLWPEFVAELEAGDYSNKLFLPIRFLDFTPGYDTNSAVLFPETVAMRELPKFTWGGIFADREAARFRAVVRAAADVTGLSLPSEAARLLADQRLAEETFVMWDLIHDRTHMHGDLPFDPFMIKQRMPYFLYSLEELRCDLTAFREAVRLESEGGTGHARLVQYAILFDRIFRFPITGTRVRNYDGLGGQLLFAWLHQRRVLNWTDNRLSVKWERVADAVLELGAAVDDLYWRSIDRPKVAHWLAAYALVSSTLTPHPASTWAKGPEALPLDGPLKGLTDAVLDDEFPLSMFYEALSRKMGPVVESTKGITA